MRVLLAKLLLYVLENFPNFFSIKKFGKFEKKLFDFVLKYKLNFNFCRGFLMAKIYDAVFFWGAPVTLEDIGYYFKFDEDIAEELKINFEKVNNFGSSLELLQYFVRYWLSPALFIYTQSYLGFLYYFSTKYKFNCQTWVQVADIEDGKYEDFYFQLLNISNPCVMLIVRLYEMDSINKNITGFIEAVLFRKVTDLEYSDKFIETDELRIQNFSVVFNEVVKKFDNDPVKWFMELEKFYETSNLENMDYFKFDGKINATILKLAYRRSDGTIGIVPIFI